jgi:hypothetical protein
LQPFPAGIVRLTGLGVRSLRERWIILRSWTPNASPARLDHWIALSRSPVRHQMIERSSRPPSRGAAGIALNIARRMLMAVIDVLVSEKRDLAATRRFFTQALITAATRAW